MKKLLLSISIILFFLPARSIAQHKISFFAGGGAFISNIDHWKLPYWNNGYALQVGAGYEINKQISLNVTTAYQRMFFDKSRAHYTYIGPIYNGTRFQVAGNNSSLLNFSANAKFFVTTGLISPYLSGGLGILYIQQGKVIHETFYGSKLVGTINFSNSGNHYLVGETNFSFGMKIGLTRRMGLDLNLKLIRAFKGPIYTPVTTSLYFTL